MEFRENLRLIGMIGLGDIHDLINDECL